MGFPAPSWETPGSGSSRPVWAFQQLPDCVLAWGFLESPASPGKECGLGYAKPQLFSLHRSASPLRAIRKSSQYGLFGSLLH